MNSFLIYWICCFFCICSCIIFVPNRACLYCLSYLFVFSKENIQFCGWKCTFLFHPCIHQSNCRSSRSYFFIPEHTFDILSKIPFRSWKYLWSFSNNFAMTFQRKILSRVCINSTKPMAQALLYSKNEKTQASKFRILLMNSINSVNSL